MTIYYVSKTGSDSGNGSAASPWQSIGKAMASNLQPGDEVVVRPGTYNESVNFSRDGSADADITLRSEVPGGAVIRPPSGNGITIRADYVTVDGFEVHGASAHGIAGFDVHHVTVSNNISHDNSESGISFAWSDFITIEGNETYKNASAGWFSGISLYQNRNITGEPDDGSFRNIIRNNVSYDNVTKGGAHTDGNGIIIDDFQSTQTSGHPNYTFRTLVDNNLVYENGGKGVQVTWSDYVTVSNNTAYHNNQDLQNTGTWRGELSNAQSSNNTWVNNIAVVDPSINSHGTAIDSTSYGGYRNANIVWENNLTFNGTAGQSSVRTDGGNAAPTAANGNLLGVDPRFVNPGTDFSLRSDSPAIDAGTAARGLGKTDVDGDARTIGNVDIGAHEHGSAPTAPTSPTAPGPVPGPANTAPDARNDSGFSTAHETPITITSASLLANDVDANGDRLTLTGVSAASGGTVEINSAGNVVFTPSGDFSGAAKFSYTVSDGKGGTDTASVSLTVAAASDAAPAPTPAPTPAASGLWDDAARPASVTTDAETRPVELGMKFRANADGEISAIQFYETAASSGSHPVSLWSSTGELLARESFTGGSGDGWREVTFDEPIKVQAGETYIASYHAPQGRYAVTEGFFDKAVAGGDITALQNGGVYSYGSSSSVPTQTYNASNYWVDVVFTASNAKVAAEIPAPTIEGTTGGDTLRGTDGEDVILGGAGNDWIFGSGGADVLRGQDGNDALRGGQGSDVLIGGKGSDVFLFRSIAESNAANPDVIRAGDGAIAFEGAGVAGGDVIDLSRLDADPSQSGVQAFIFGSKDKGGLWLTDVDGRTLVSGNVNDDSAAEFQLWIEDGNLAASAYVASDFIL
ncbi:DUF4082 domain-containing protein [Paracoccus sp. S-4012]|uniref:DUF4082 domain-containing protein n=1 Tax=Paracoccus sp. S-4012 TaxID=2665648 RepID=UPI0012B03719|nr:DUF4082 domain-containing protein [Paracoccus sp. S-4012]MRX52030.1 DUF4082 domain-containing protein [Paracoccus sp. S-4012]